MNKKTDDCSSCKNLNQRLKVLQADYDFEIKKISEDKSTEKAMLELNTNREIKKLQQKCLKQKQQRIKQNQLWMTKYDELIERQKHQMTQYKISKDKDLEAFKKIKNQEIENFKKCTLTQLEDQIKNLIVQKENLQISMVQKYENQISNLNKFYQDKMSKLLSKHQEDLNRKCQQYEATILGIQSEKNVQENLHRKTKEESKDAQSRLNQQIYILKRNIIELDEKIVTLKTQIQQKCEQIESLHVEMLQMQKNFSQNQQKLIKQNDEKFESHKKMMQGKLEYIIKRELQNCSKYEKALQKIEQHREIENQMYKANLSEIKGCVEERPSRYEDIEEIIKLREKLNKKQRQCDSLSEELKYYRLQLQNKEETYNKIFGPDSKHSESVMIKRKDLRMKRGGRSVTTVRQILGSANINPNILAPLVGNLEKKLLPPKQNKIL